MRRRPAIIGLGIAAAVAASAAIYLLRDEAGSADAYRVEVVERGPVSAIVTATGTISAVTTVQVGSQVSGMVKALFADFNTRVKKNQLIARIDPELFETKVNQARADLESAQAAVLNQQANVERARADVENSRAALAGGRAQTAKAQVAVLDAKRDLDRKSDLFKRELIARSEKDSAQAAHDSAVAQWEATRAQEQALASAIRSVEAQLKVAEAQLQAAQAQVRQKRAALAQAQVDLDHTYIRAPVDGVVVSRSVDVGQTVAASLQAPTLFTIAQDLTQMQVDTNVDEADIGRIQLGQRATFSVDSFPGQGFSGEVTQIRKAPQVVQNVVTYIVVISVQNPGGKLLPGMTANVRVVVDHKPSVLKIPNSALRFRPQTAQAAPGQEARPQTPRQRPERGSTAGTSRPPDGGPGRGGLSGRVWILGPDGNPKAVAVQMGITDGSFTEVTEGDLGEGQEVIAGGTPRPAGGSGPRLRL